MARDMVMVGAKPSTTWLMMSSILGGSLLHSCARQYPPAPCITQVTRNLGDYTLKFMLNS